MGRTTLNPEQFLNWLEQIYATREAEIDCERLQALLPTYVDVEVAGGDLGEARLVPVRAHLAQCPACHDEYQGLLAVARLEAQGRLPEAEESLAQFEEEIESTSEAVPVH
jgi:predicted anti-sigma-YlaC factor YlaD